MRPLEELRVEIDEIDQQLVKLYEARMAISKEVGEFKLSTGKPVFDKERELQKLETAEDLVDTKLNKVGVRGLFEHIMSVSRKHQYELLAKHGKSEEVSFTAVEQLKDKGVKVVFQGIEGAYSQMALYEYFGDAVESYHVQTFRDAMEAIKNGEADYAVLPIENSSAGAVTQVYDLLVDYDNYIVGELAIHIEHSLAGITGAKIEDIKKVYSHPQALMQSEKFIEEHRDMEQISVANTAVAAKKVYEDNEIEKAAICSEYAANIYGLEILASKINYNDENATRFIVVTSEKVCLKDAKKISICFEVPHESGSLYHLLSHFIYNNLNMTKIESRPLEGRNWEYLFFVDFDGNLQEEAVKNALRGLKEESKNLKILGNY